MVLSIGETVLEVRDSGYLASSPTLHTSLFGDDSLIQVHPKGIRHIRADKRIQEWQPPESRFITMVAVNSRQVVASLGGGEIIYFELDASNQLVEIETAQTGAEIVAMGIAPVPSGVERARFLAIADMNNKMRIFSLYPTDCLTTLSMQLLPHRVSSLSIVEMPSYGGSALYVNMGTENGVLYTATLDKSNGQLATQHDTRVRFLGRSPVKLFPIQVNNSDALLALSSRSWVCFNYEGRYTMMPLSYVPLGFASSFNSEQCPEGIVSVAAENLRIFSMEQLGNMFNQTSIPLRYTPHKIMLHPFSKDSKYLIISESDDDTYPYEEKLQVKRRTVDMVHVKKENLENGENRMDIDPTLIQEETSEALYGVPRPGPGTWASCIRILDLTQSQTIDLMEMTNNEVIVSFTHCTFTNRQGEIYLPIGTAQDLVFEPRRGFKSGWIHLYVLLENGTKFHLIHKTETGAIPGAMVQYDGKLLVGCGPILRLYDYGKKKLLRKCEYKQLPNHIVSIWVQQDLIVVGDIQQSYFFMKYNRMDNKFVMLADDTVPRWLTTGVMLDNTTICGADKFGNVFVLRLPDSVAQQIEEDPTAGSIPWQHKHIIGAPYKLEMLAHFYVAETIIKLIKTTLTPGGNEVILYVTIFGSIGVLLPFSSREDIDFFTKLEGHLRQEKLSLIGREHLSFRSYYTPCKNVIDGDLCEQFPLLSGDVQKKIADELEREPPELLRKLEIMRNSIG
eukprot:TRINITY_DN7590_c0_g1_i6.p1 TRINITY_DN7590_c0_g1~~TRINITY_DN7590_c0_g1_i6.p1  ORF type:complete len:732 (+),score=137.55 TRINITY_DN7590_c0_g1_i6:1565-3760(+)